MDALGAVKPRPSREWVMHLVQPLANRAVARPARAPAQLQRAWADLFSTASIVNLGLSSQLALLGLLCLVGRPYLYVSSFLAQVVYVAAVQGVRVHRLRRTLHQRSGNPA